MGHCTRQDTLRRTVRTGSRVHIKQSSDGVSTIVTIFFTGETCFFYGSARQHLESEIVRSIRAFDRGVKLFPLKTFVFESFVVYWRKKMYS